MQEEFEPAGPFPIYVPREGSRALADVNAGSAIVGFPTKTDPMLVHVYYEGNRYGSDDLRRFADRAKLAAGRCRWFRLDLEKWQREHADSPPPPTEHGYAGYPTSAQAFVPATELIEVAFYDDVLGIVRATGNEQAALLGDWVGPVDSLEYFATGIAFDQRRAASGLTVDQEASPSDRGGK
jgi:hypothetical protein